MSASERLKRLERTSRDLRFHPENVREAREDVIRALPQIVAVVEAAEALLNDRHVRDLRLQASLDARAALSALEEALS